MCGITGYLAKGTLIKDTDKIIAMARSIRYRGPDDEGFMLADTATGKSLNCCGVLSDSRIRVQHKAVEGSRFPHNLAFSQGRFSIIDLSPAGHQPMWDKGGDVCVAFNGEIFNYIEIKQELERLGRSFATHSDTEVILEGYLEWGAGAFSRFNGQWALSLYDRRNGRLLLSRDRMGKSPLYYAIRDSRLYWASEIKAIREACGAGAFQVRGQAVDDYIMHGWRDIDGTFWEGIEDFPPASFAWIKPDLTLDVQRYWSLHKVRLTEKHISVREAVINFSDILLDSVKIRLRADVPVAFELSGGMDSSAIVALAASKLNLKVSTYTVEFPQEHSNEEPFARALYDRYRDSLDYHVIKPGEDDFWEDADLFVHVQEEPFHSPVLHTNQKLRQIIRRDGIKVVLNGAAGDELLAGYAHKYVRPFLRLLITEGRFGSLIREVASNTEISAIRYARNRFMRALTKAIGLSKKKKDPLVQIYRKPGELVPRPGPSKDFSQCMRDNMTEWLMNYWMRSGNKATFEIPMEGRYPFMDHRLIDYSFSLPPEYLIRNGWHKWILRQATKDFLPDKVVWRRRKMGFPFPLKEWLEHSMETVAGCLKGLECPYVNFNKMIDLYAPLKENDPQMLWRFISLGLWWKKVILGKNIA